MLIRRTPRPESRTVALRVGLFFVAAGTWLGGLINENRRLTAAAAVILVLALLIGIGERLRHPVQPLSDDEGDDGEDDGDDDRE